jgi:hypothetical protein
MGTKIRFRKIPTLEKWLCFMAMGISISSVLWVQCPSACSANQSNVVQAKAVQAIVVQAEFKMSEIPLTTEKIWKIDPFQINPHRQRWLDSRQSQLVGLKASLRGHGKYAVSVSQIQSLIQGYVRGSGPWFQPYEYFSCEPDPDAWFATQEGAKKAAEKASEIWIALLKEKEVQLRILLSRISADTEQIALGHADDIFKKWIQEVDQEWRKTSPALSRKEEWNYYLDESSSRGYCTENMKNQRQDQTQEKAQWKGWSWESLMEPAHSGAVSSEPKLLARAPVRLWNGLYSIRADVKVAGKTLNGRFLIDSGATHSVLSPTWLENQGIHPIWVEQLDSGLVSLLWGGVWENHVHLARRGRIDGFVIGGLSIPLTEWFLLDTDFFGPPEHVGYCCDGVLGLDFLKLYPIEFSSKLPVELKIWSKEDFHWSVSVPWVEASIDNQGFLSSSCTGSSTLSALFLHTQSVTVDLPHGRIWLSNQLPILGDPRKNSSGLKLSFVMAEGERTLKVVSLVRGSRAEKLWQGGLRVGTVVSQLDSIPVEDLDQWEVDRRLSGAYAETLSIQWKDQRNLKMAPLQVR